MPLALKLDEVWAAIRASNQENGRLTLLGKDLCQYAFKKLLAMGSSRFRRLRASVLSGMEDCPYDKRFVTRALTNLAIDKRQSIHDFLFHLYETLAEPMPQGTGASKRPRLEKKRDDKEIMAATGLVEKALPPGTFHEYLEMYRRDSKQQVSYKLFCSVAALASVSSVCLHVLRFGSATSAMC